jgi:hypothetical protein
VKIVDLRSYRKLTESLKTEGDLSFDSDRAVAEYVAFGSVGEVHAERVDNPKALEVMLEVSERINSCLRKRQKVLSLS